MQGAVEHVNGENDHLLAYNTDPLLGPEIVLPQFTVLAIKEPYYETTADGGANDRIDRPSDLIRVHPLDPYPAGPVLPTLCRSLEERA